MRRAQHGAGFANNGTGVDYELTDKTEVPYLFANGVRLARVVFDDSLTGVPDDPVVSGLDGNLRVFFELGDHLGSTSIVIDKATGELVERGTYQAYGAADSDYRPNRWAAFREDYRFTGKEEDVEVGLVYFGKRFYAPLLGRWCSPDPLGIHEPGDADWNLYAYVRAFVLKAIDPLGLQDNQQCYANDVDIKASEQRVDAAETQQQADASRSMQEAPKFEGPKPAGTDFRSPSERVADGANAATFTGVLSPAVVALYAVTGDTAQFERLQQFNGTVTDLTGAAATTRQNRVSPDQETVGRIDDAIRAEVQATRPPGPGGKDAKARVVETTSPRPVKPEDAATRWDEFLAPGPTSSRHPRTGETDPNRIVSADGSRSIRYGNHEMNSSPTKHHYHEEFWSADRSFVRSVIVRVPGQKK